MKKKRIWLKLIVVLLLIAGVLQAGIYLMPRIKLNKMGYAKEEIETIMTLPKEMRNQLMETAYIENVQTWLNVSTQIDRYLSYNAYSSFHEDLSAEEAAAALDLVWDHPDIFIFSRQQNRDEFYQKASPEVIEAYLQSKENEHFAEDPESLTLVVSQENQLSISYAPSELEKCVLENAEADDPEGYMAKEANEALKKMAEDAAKEGYELLNNSSYRSYFDQEDIYAYYEELYGLEYCEHYVATPGYSEHQTGLAIDLSSRSVQDGTYYVFGDSPDYQWVNAHCYEYGFIRRYPENKSDLTGAYNEPWHYRYVGLEAAKIIHDNDWVLEEYEAYYNE